MEISSSAIEFSCRGGVCTSPGSTASTAWALKYFPNMYASILLLYNTHQSMVAPKDIIIVTTAVTIHKSPPR
jgi:hypothetical protein